MGNFVAVAGLVKGLDDNEIGTVETRLPNFSRDPLERKNWLS
ncbi:hypothetical protein BDW16_1710 [Sphingomonas koreensis]|nr:hypothetical protein BDW16_1710 [Sphingomonas koreensis]